MPAFLLPTDRAALRVNALCFLVLCLEGYDVSSLGFATPSLIEAWHVSAPQFTMIVTLGAVGMLVGSMGAGILGDPCHGAPRRRPGYRTAWPGSNANAGRRGRSGELPDRPACAAAGSRCRT